VNLRWKLTPTGDEDALALESAFEAIVSSMRDA
jgi:hypothetical protein